MAVVVPSTCPDPATGVTAVTEGGVVSGAEPAWYTGVTQ